jgi:hypothetical protein
MSRRSTQLLFAVAIGVLVTTVTAFAASALTSESAREILFWPNTLLQSFVSAPNIGTPHHPLYEGTPLNSLAFLVSFPFAVIVYGAIAYVFLHRLKT